MTKNEVIQALIELHKKQRAWQRLVNNEELNIKQLKSMSIKDLKAVYEVLSKKNKEN